MLLMPDLETTRAKAREMLPSYMVPGILGYLERGEPVGGFLSALLSNDLRGTFERADGTNAPLIRTYLEFLYNYAPVRGGPRSGSKAGRGLEAIGLVGRDGGLNG
jgi:hypothetical protein